MSATPTNIVHPDDDGIRPGGPPDECFYCQQKVGQPHLLDRCPCVTRVVRMKFIFEIDVEVNAGWEVDMIHFRYNDSSWCADNAIDYIETYLKKKGEGDCLCEDFEARYVREVDSTPRSHKRPRTPEEQAEEDRIRKSWNR